MLLWLLLALLGGAGCVVFGVPMGMDALYGAQFMKTSGAVPGVIQRSIKGSLRPFLVSLALLVVGLVLMSVCSTARHREPDSPETPGTHAGSNSTVCFVRSGTSYPGSAILD